jgi:hypothetical protein
MDSVLLATDTFKSGVAFPLTPALSLRERENYRQRAGEADTLGIVERLAALLPLPKGEGWGEGEQAARPLKAPVITDSPLRSVGEANPH